VQQLCCRFGMKTLLPTSKSYENDKEIQELNVCVCVVDSGTMLPQRERI